MTSTNTSPDGTSFQGQTFVTSTKKLLELSKKFKTEYEFGEHFNYYFIFETSAGDVFTLYDFLESPETLEQEVEWRIGAKTIMASELATEELENELSKIEA